MFTLFSDLHRRLGATVDFMGSTVPDMARIQAQAATPEDGGFSVVPLLRGRLVFVRSERLMRSLSMDEALSRGPSLSLLRAVFVDALFLLPHGDEHSARRGEFKQHLGKARITELVPLIANHAASTAQRLALHAARTPHLPVDMADEILGYLFGVASNAIAGADAGLGADVARYRGNSDIVLSRSSSTLVSALAAVHDRIARLLATPASAAAADMLHTGHALLVTAARHPDRPTLALVMMQRHGIAPDKVGPDFRFPERLLYEITMTFAASTFTSSQLMLMTLDHYSRHPRERQQLRDRIHRDFPGGIAGLATLPLCDAVRQLLPVMLRCSPVSTVVRDVAAGLTFTDDRYRSQRLEAGDCVIFDLATLQSAQAEPLHAHLAEARGPALDLLDARHNDLVKTFYDGPFQCPGRFLGIADSMLLLLAVISGVDGAWEDGPRRRTHQLVDQLSGSSRMRLSSAPPAHAPGQDRPDQA